ncbi:MAG TPA: HAMP domain-containing sensor histidine kinase [Vicinamibacterales bacterium]|nr:HAMP domain-containing sensor histidine kinase [Vicinamibacterales bacterium]
MPSVPLPSPKPAADSSAGVRRRQGSLWLRFSLFLAAAIAAVIGATTYLQSRLVEGTLEAELLETARLSALAAADDLALRPDLSDPDAVEQYLKAFGETVPEIRSLSMVTTQAGRTAVFASTASAVPEGLVAVGQHAIERRGVERGETAGALRVIAAPIAGGGRVGGAVAVTVSFEPLYRLRDRGRRIAAWATLCSVIALFGAVEWLVRWLIRRPIGGIRLTMEQVTRGDLAARAPVRRNDEIGAVATGLNSMLGQLQDLHESLQQRVSQATEELRARNRDLLDLYQQMFRLREELGRSQQLAAVGETASAVAHQIGTPLNLVSGHIQLAMESLDSASPLARRLKIAEEQIDRVTVIVKDLLSRSRRPLRRDRVDLLALLRRLCALVSPALEAAGVRLRFEGEPVPPVEADAVQLELALLNLVSNAIDAMPGGGDLAIRLAGRAGRALIEVSDTGVGMPPELADRVFQPWVTTKAAGHGTGLGLSIARNVIVEHGGSVGVTSVAGEGSVFTVDLPLPSPSATMNPAHG